jgi:hypothetical protein
MSDVNARYKKEYPIEVDIEKALDECFDYKGNLSF